MPLTFREGDHLRVSGAAGVDVCEVLRIIRPEKLPEQTDLLALAVTVAAVKAFASERGVDVIVLLKGRLGAPNPVVFWVMHLEQPDEWIDLREKELNLEVCSPAEVRGKDAVTA